MRIAQGSIVPIKTRRSKPYRWRYKGKDMYFATEGEAIEARDAFLLIA